MARGERYHGTFENGEKCDVTKTQREVGGRKYRREKYNSTLHAGSCPTGRAMPPQKVSAPNTSSLGASCRKQ
jgi:hypothetical protein